VFKKPLEDDWIDKVEQFGIDESISINIPLLKVKKYILKHKENSLTERYIQISINYILNNSRHPFYYLKDIPVELMKSIFDEVKNEQGINFSIKIYSCITEALAFNKLIQKRYIYKGKTPSKSLEDDFYISSDDKDFAFEVKSKLSKDYYLDYVQDYIQGKMLAHDYKKSIGISCDTVINQDNLPDLLNYLDTYILIDDNINDTIHYENKQCFDKTCFSSEGSNEIITDFRDNNKDDYTLTIRTSEFNMIIMIKEIEKQFNGGVVKTALGITKYESKLIDDTLILDFNRKLDDIIKQYINEKKHPTRDKDGFGGFIFLQIPWFWDWIPQKISNIFYDSAIKILKTKEVYFPIYVYLSKYEKKNILLKFNISRKSYRKKRLTKYKSIRVKVK